MTQSKTIMMEYNGEFYTVHKFDDRSVTVSNSLGVMETVMLDLQGWSHFQPQRFRFGIIRGTLSEALKDVFEYFEAKKKMAQKFDEETKALGL